MKVHLHGQLATLCGPTHTVDADCVEDAIRALSLQIKEWPREMLIDVPGFETVERLTAKTDIEEIHLLPSVFGGGGKFGSIILGVAMIGLSLIPGAQPGTLLLNSIHLS